MGNEIKPFSTVLYVTKNGEQCVATKNDGVVTIQGDKNGVRQMPIKEFIEKEMVNIVDAKGLERTPDQDTFTKAK